MSRLTSDSLSPILVKELRQGIRSKLFIGSFFVVQLCLFIFGFSLVSSTTVRGDPQMLSVFFWSMLGIPLILMVPTAASQAIEKEVTGNTLELLILTKLSAYRIVLGKWGAVIVQATLIVTSALPYVILRYFVGGIDVWSELRMVASFLLASSLLAGIGLGFWATKMARWAKWAVVLLFFWLAQIAVAVLMMPHGGLGLGGSGTSTILWLYGALIMFMMLEIAAARIAPPAENHVTRVRALALLGIFPVFLFDSPQMQAECAVAGILLAGATLLVSLNEGIRPVPRLYFPFTTGGTLRNVLTAPFCPGWPGGVAFAFVCLAALPFLPPFDGELSVVGWLSIVGTFFLPVAILRTFLPSAKKVLGLYLVLLMLSTVPMYVWGALTAFGQPGAVVGYLFSLSPPFVFMMALTDKLPWSWGMIQTFVSLIGVLVTTRLAHRAWGEIAALAESAASTPAEKAPTTPVGAAPEGSPS